MERILLILLLAAIVLSGCMPEAQAAPSVVISQADALKSTYDEAAITDLSSEPCEIQLAAWPRAYALYYQDNQQFGIEVSCGGQPVMAGALIACVDETCQALSTNLEGYGKATFESPEGGWTLGEHVWKISYVDRSPAKVLSSKFVAIGGE